MATELDLVLGQLQQQAKQLAALVVNVDGIKQELIHMNARNFDERISGLEERQQEIAIKLAELDGADIKQRMANVETVTQKMNMRVATMAGSAGIGAGGLVALFMKLFGG